MHNMVRPATSKSSTRLEASSGAELAIPTASKAGWSVAGALPLSAHCSHYHRSLTHLHIIYTCMHACMYIHMYVHTEPCCVTLSQSLIVSVQVGTTSRVQ